MRLVIKLKMLIYAQCVALQDVSCFPKHFCRPTHQRISVYATELNLFFKILSVCHLSAGVRYPETSRGPVSTSELYPRGVTPWILTHTHIHTNVPLSHSHLGHYAITRIGLYSHSLNFLSTILRDNLQHMPAGKKWSWLGFKELPEWPFHLSSRMTGPEQEAVTSSRCWCWPGL